MQLNAPGWVFMICQTYCFSFFLSDWNTFDTPCIFRLKYLFILIPCNPLPSLNWVIKLTLNWDITLYHIWKLWSNTYHKIVFLDNVTMLLSLLTHFNFSSVFSYYLATYDTHYFFPFINFLVFSLLLLNCIIINILRQTKLGH